jgi:hypothetical protein
MSQKGVDGVVRQLQVQGKELLQITAVLSTGNRVKLGLKLLPQTRGRFTTPRTRSKYIASNKHLFFLTAQLVTKQSTKIPDGAGFSAVHGLSPGAAFTPFSALEFFTRDP